MGPYAHTHYVKVPKHFGYIQYGSEIQFEACCGLNHDITTSHLLRSTPITIPKSTPDLQRRITVGVAPYAHTPHTKVPKHFVYIQYGFVIQSEACCSLYHYIITLHGLGSTPKTRPNSTPDMHRRITVRVDPYAHTHHIKVPKPFVYI